MPPPLQRNIFNTQENSKQNLLVLKQSAVTLIDVKQMTPTGGRRGSVVITKVRLGSDGKRWHNNDLDIL
jgi:hypothetical protein